jgi:DNA-binding NtrC family response regulator
MCANCTLHSDAGAQLRRQGETSLSFKEAKSKVISSYERQFIQALLRVHDNNIRKAAYEAGIDLEHLLRLMRKHGIAARPDDVEDDET